MKRDGVDSESEIMRRCIEIVQNQDDPVTVLEQYSSSAVAEDRVRAIVRDELQTLGVTPPSGNDGVSVASEAAAAQRAGESREIDPEIREAIDNLDWSDFDLTKRPERVDWLAFAVSELRRLDVPLQNHAIQQLIRQEFDVEIGEASVQKLISAALSQLDVVDSSGGDYEWVGEE